MANKKITDLMSGTPVRDSLLESAIDISGTMDSRKVKAGAVADLASANIAAPYDTTVTYAIGQYCLYEGNIYRCIAITTGAFDSTKWTQIVVTGEFRRVVELTSAQYTALSSAEKNNGTLYVITDEETTAADIPVEAGSSTMTKTALDGKANSADLAEVATSGDFYDLTSKPIRKYTVTSSSPVTLRGQLTAGYATFIIIGFAEGLGGVVVAIEMAGGSLSKVINLLNGQNFSSTHLSFSASNSQLTISSDMQAAVMIFG